MLAVKYYLTGGAGEYTGIILWVSSSNYLQLLIYRNSGSATISIPTALTLVDNTEHEIVFSVTRETADVDGSCSVYIDETQWGATQTIDHSAVTNPGLSLSNAGILYVSGSGSARTASVNKGFIFYNRALTAAEVLDLYRNGINYADKWGSQTAVYTSDFSAGSDSWSATNGVVAGNIDGIGGYDDVLRFTCSAAAATHNAYKGTGSGITANKKYKASLEYYIPSTNSNIDGLMFGGSGAYTAIQNTLDAWTAITFEYTAPNVNFMCAAYDGASASFTDAGADDVFYIKNTVLTEIGATLALEPEGIQPNPGQWLDSSTNKLHAWQPAAGSSLVRNMRTFEIRGTNTWAGTHEAQSIAWATDASKAILPVGCYITDIIGVVAGATIEDIIVGDGSDTDRWVAVTTGLAAGTTAFTIANRISDGTNYEMVVDPDANFTGSITWLIRGIILS
jgi:hypothetical protein